MILVNGRKIRYQDCLLRKRREAFDKVIRAICSSLLLKVGERKDFNAEHAEDAKVNNSRFKEHKFIP